MASILLVEDDTDLASAIKLWFERKGYVIENVTTGAEALECIRFEKFDLIILDGHLPDMTGVEICSHYRTGGGTSPVLMLSGLSAADEIAAGLAAGAASSWVPHEASGTASSNMPAARAERPIRFIVTPT